jgi:hypothetical protein
MSVVAGKTNRRKVFYLLNKVRFSAGGVIDIAQNFLIFQGNCRFSQSGNFESSGSPNLLTS